jgi:hypothetical protein
MPLTAWSHKYACRSKGLANDKIAKYGKHILEARTMMILILFIFWRIFHFLQAMKFLYDKDFPHLQLGHIQSGNIFVVDDVCLLGGYENTLLGYRTRLFRLCKDHLQHFDVILFGKEMKSYIAIAACISMQASLFPGFSSKPHISTEWKAGSGPRDIELSCRPSV